MLHKAADADALAVAADLIGEVADTGQRAELAEVWKSVLARMEA
ncbi:MAG: hypothetical protein Q8O34_16710 [Rhodocyclaceae bacterium]|nr:hypothetical protein [Rhodocyclaceae bacterium]